MRLFIDARFWGTEHTGLGRYTKNVLDYLPELLKVEATVLVQERHKDLKFGNWQVISSSVRPYSVAEQLVIPYLVKRSRASLYLGLHFNIPLLLGTPYIAVIHDLIKSHFSGAYTTTRAHWIYHLKRLGYKLTMRLAVTRALAIIVPSNTVKNDILSTYLIEPSRVEVIPEAVDLQILRPSRYQVPFTKYLLYVGNSYPHKNLALVLSALAKLSLNLVMVTKRSAYLDHLLHRVTPTTKSRLYIVETTTDQELAGLYRHALVTVCPSLMEGYGLPGVESLAVGTPVVASNIPVYREVYGQRVEYFEPSSVSSLVRALKRAVKQKRVTYKSKHTWREVVKHIVGVIDASRTRLR